MPSKDKRTNGANANKFFNRFRSIKSNLALLILAAILAIYSAFDDLYATPWRVTQVFFRSFFNFLFGTPALALIMLFAGLFIALPFFINAIKEKRAEFIGDLFLETKEYKESKEKYRQKRKDKSCSKELINQSEAAEIETLTREFRERAGKFLVNDLIEKERNFILKPVIVSTSTRRWYNFFFFLKKSNFEVSYISVDRFRDILLSEKYNNHTIYDLANDLIRGFSGKNINNLQDIKLALIGIIKILGDGNSIPSSNEKFEKIVSCLEKTIKTTQKIHKYTPEQYEKLMVFYKIAPIFFDNYDSDTLFDKEMTIGESREIYLKALNKVSVTGFFSGFFEYFESAVASFWTSFFTEDVVSLDTWTLNNETSAATAALAAGGFKQALSVIGEWQKNKAVKSSLNTEPLPEKKSTKKKPAAKMRTPQAGMVNTAEAEIRLLDDDAMAQSSDEEGSIPLRNSASTAENKKEPSASRKGLRDYQAETEYKPRQMLRLFLSELERTQKGHIKSINDSKLNRFKFNAIQLQELQKILQLSNNYTGNRESAEEKINQFYASKKNKKDKKYKDKLEAKAKFLFAEFKNVGEIMEDLEEQVSGRSKFSGFFAGVQRVFQMIIKLGFIEWFLSWLAPLAAWATHVKDAFNEASDRLNGTDGNIIELVSVTIGAVLGFILFRRKDRKDFEKERKDLEEEYNKKKAKLAELWIIETQIAALVAILNTYGIKEIKPVGLVGACNDYAHQWLTAEHFQKLQRFSKTLAYIYTLIASAGSPILIYRLTLLVLLPTIAPYIAYGILATICTAVGGYALPVTLIVFGLALIWASYKTYKLIKQHRNEIARACLDRVETDLGKAKGDRSYLLGLLNCSQLDPDSDSAKKFAEENELKLGDSPELGDSPTITPKATAGVSVVASTPQIIRSLPAGALPATKGIVSPRPIPQSPLVALSARFHSAVTENTLSAPVQEVQRVYGANTPR